MVLRLKHPNAFKKRLLRGGKSPKASRQNTFRNCAKDFKPQVKSSQRKNSIYFVNIQFIGICNAEIYFLCRTKTNVAKDMKTNSEMVIYNIS